MMCFFLIACDNKEGNPVEKNVNDIPLEDIAQIFSAINMNKENLSEVYDAVESSIKNGYDEEYMMTDLFFSPGTGVGAKDKTKSDSKYSRPLRELIQQHLEKTVSTKSAGCPMVEDYLVALESSDIQIYWPYSHKWDRETYPTITFAPEGNQTENIGYRLSEKEGERVNEKVIVDEEYAKQYPVWIINRNEDSAYPTLELLRAEDPNFGAGGDIIVKKAYKTKTEEAEEGELKTLILKEFTMKRNYDTWFAGASEFLVKTGSVENFTASTEAEMKLFSPSVTDFMIVVKRGQENIPVPFNAVLVSDWSPQLDKAAFMIVEDDGGTKTSWKCGAVVKLSSKSYGFEITIPINTRDDLVWRGQLSNRYISAYDNVVGHFGDVDLKFEIVKTPL